MAIKKAIQAAMVGRKIVRALYLCSEIDLDWDNWGYCPTCRVYSHNEETDENGDCPFCHEIRESLPNQRYYGMMPHERRIAKQLDADMAWYNSVRL